MPISGRCAIAGMSWIAQLLYSRYASFSRFSDDITLDWGQYELSLNCTGVGCMQSAVHHF
jgi:hypothetical protein